MPLSNLHTIHIHALLEPPLPFPNLHIIPAHHPLPHPPIRIERPVLQPIAPFPLHPITRILILVPKLHGDLVLGEREQFLPQPVVLLLRPLLCEKGFDSSTPLQEGGPVAPDAGRRVGFRYAGRGLGVPEVLGGFDFGVGGGGGEGGGEGRGGGGAHSGGRKGGESVPGG